MKCKIVLTVNSRTDSKREIEQEMALLQKIIGKEGEVTTGQMVFEFDFYEFYKKLRDEITEKVEAYK